MEESLDGDGDNLNGSPIFHIKMEEDVLMKQAFKVYRVGIVQTQVQ